MSKIVIIGAGAMGSAFAVPCADNSNEVFLVGSFLEDSVIEEIKSLNNFHPILKTQLPENIKVLKFSEFSGEIKINIDAFENIELSSTDMMVTQSGVPYPIVVPSFPILTDDSKLNYGEEMEKINR